MADSISSPELQTLTAAFVRGFHAQQQLTLRQLLAVQEKACNRLLLALSEAPSPVSAALSAAFLQLKSILVSARKAHQAV